MHEENKIIRWYDRYTKLPRALSIISRLPAGEQDELSKNVAKFINILRATREESKIEAVSIGKDRVLGLYKSANNNRWYDKNLNIKGVMNIISTLSDDDIEKVAEGIIRTVGAQAGKL